MDLPAFKTPISSSSSRKDVLVLSLYYRWALQSLSAISFLHSHAIYLRVFSSQMVWLRSDFSLAITGFINAVTQSKFPHKDLPHDQPSQEYQDELPLEDDGMVTDEWICEAGDGIEIPGVQEDLFQWAIFVWRLMTPCEPTDPYWPWEPSSPRPDDPIADYGQNKDTLQALMSEKHGDSDIWQELEDERLGKVLIKAWKGGYESAEDVVGDVKTMAKKIGIVTIGDEVDVGLAWEDVLEVAGRGNLLSDRELRLRPFKIA